MKADVQDVSSYAIKEILQRFKGIALKSSSATAYPYLLPSLLCSSLLWWVMVGD